LSVFRIRGFGFSGARAAGLQGNPPGGRRRRRVPCHPPGALSSPAASRGGPPMCHPGGTTPACDSLEKFSAELGMGRDRAASQTRAHRSRARAQQPGTSSTQAGPGCAPRRAPGDPGGSGEPRRGRERTRFLKPRFLLPYLRPSLTSQGTSLEERAGPRHPEPAPGWRGRQRPPQERKVRSPTVTAQRAGLCTRARWGCGGPQLYLTTYECAELPA
jgi:hypothetical protein